MRNKLIVKEIDREAINKFKNTVVSKFPDAKFILYGSKARREDSEFSDIDILVLLDRKIVTEIEKEIFGIGFEIGLQYNVVFGIVVEENTFWNSPLGKAMPFHWAVSREGIMI